MNLKYTHQLSENDKVTSSLLINGDNNKYQYNETYEDSIQYSFNKDISEKTTNSLITAGWEHTFSPDLISNVYFTKIMG